MPLIFKIGAWVLAAFSIIAGLAVLASDVPLLQQDCRRMCPINALLFVLFGERGGRVALAAIWFAAAVLALWIVYSPRTRRDRGGKRKHGN
jgi:hypothetical protein